MNLLPNSGKFWLKLLIFSLIAVIATAAGLYASVYNFFTPKRIETLTQSALQSTQRTIRFSPEIRRSWFPRPTLTLKNVVISYPNSTQAAIHIKETNIGIGWSSLWNDTPIIEKWVLKGADVSIERTENGKWSLQDLWQQPRNTATLNRLVVENSTLHLKLDNTPYTIEDFSLNLRSEDSDAAVSKSAATSAIRSSPSNGTATACFKPTQQTGAFPSSALKRRAAATKTR